MSVFSLGTRIFMGEDALCSAINGSRRVFVVTDKFMFKSGKISYVTDRLIAIGAEYTVFSDVEADPDIDMVAAGMKIAMEFGPDLIIAFGGGSSIDAAKVILFLSKRASGMKDCPFIAIPTTSGTGSEVSRFAVITDKRNNVKHPIVHDDLLPDIAVLDAGLVISVPSKVTADAGIDVLTHAIEAFVSTSRTDFSDAMAEKAIKLVYRYLLRVHTTPDDLEARQRIHNASCIAGVAFSNAGLGLNHAMAHALGGKFHLPHGMANGILLPYVMSFNAGCTTKLTATAVRYAKIARLLNLDTETVRQSALNSIRMIRVFIRKLDMPSSIREVVGDKKVFEGMLDELVDTAMADSCISTTPKECTREDIIQVFSNAYNAKLP